MLSSVSKYLTDKSIKNADYLNQTKNGLVQSLQVANLGSIAHRFNAYESMSASELEAEVIFSRLSSAYCTHLSKILETSVATDGFLAQYFEDKYREIERGMKAKKF